MIVVKQTIVCYHSIVTRLLTVPMEFFHSYKMAVFKMREINYFFYDTV